MSAMKVLVFAAAAWLASSDNQLVAEGLADMALPDVEFFMEAAQDPLKEFGEQAKLLQKQVAQHEEEKRDAIVKMKASFEQNLTSQALACDQIGEESAKLNAAIASKQDEITKLRQEAKMAQKSNDIMRAALDGLRPKMRLAAKYLGDSLNTTDDSNATELNVLRATTPEPTLERFLSTMREGGRKVSLLGIGVQDTGKAVTPRSAKRGASEATPEELVGTLAQRLDALAAAGDQGEAQLQARFLADYEIGSKKKAAMQATKQALEQDFMQKQNLHAELIDVKLHLLRIRSQLEERVKGIRLFAMNGTAMATGAMEQAAIAFKGSTH